MLPFLANTATPLKSSGFAGTAKKGVWGTDALGMESERPASLTRTAALSIFVTAVYVVSKRRTRTSADSTTNVLARAFVTKEAREAMPKPTSEYARRFSVSKMARVSEESSGLKFLRG